MNLVVRFLSLIVSLIVALNISVLRIPLGNNYYYIMFFSFITLLMFKPKIKINLLFVALILVIGLSILLNDIPSFFKPIQRYIAFIFIMLLVSPLVSSSVLLKFRKSLFLNLNYLIFFMSVLSSFVLILGLNFRPEGRVDFNGIFGHSMILGPMSAISSLFSFTQSKNSSNRVVKYFFFIGSFLSFIACISSGSRAALLSFLIGFLFLLYKNYQGSISSFSKILIVISLFLAISFPIWKKYTIILISKSLYGMKQGDIAVSRTFIWENRISEFKSSPIIGIGFASVNTAISDNFEVEGGKIEPGSSWLAILSMTGLLGFVTVFLIFYDNFRTIIRIKSKDPRISFLGGVLVLLFVHMFAEGYIFSAGSGMFFYLWLLIGNINIEKNNLNRNL